MIELVISLGDVDDVAGHDGGFVFLRCVCDHLGEPVQQFDQFIPRLARNVGQIHAGDVERLALGRHDAEVCLNAGEIALYNAVEAIENREDKYECGSAYGHAGRAYRRDDVYHIDKRKFKVPFVCGAKDLGEALRRINEGATMIRTKGEPGTGDVIQAVRHMRMMQSEIRRLVSMSEDELYEAAKQLRVPYDLVDFVHNNGKLPVVNFAAGGVATPADAALMMQLGAEGVFVGSGIFKSGDPVKRAQAIVKAVTNYNNPKVIAELSEDLGEAMVGINESEIELLMAERGK